MQESLGCTALGMYIRLHAPPDAQKENDGGNPLPIPHSDQQDAITSGSRVSRSNIDEVTLLVPMNESGFSARQSPARRLRPTRSAPGLMSDKPPFETCNTFSSTDQSRDGLMYQPSEMCDMNCS